MASLIATLFEGHYHLGAAALLNSLHKSGFKGVFVCGHRGPIPAWAEEAKAVLAPAIEVLWVEQNTQRHLTYHKPRFLSECLPLAKAKGCDQLCYLDPDLVIKAPWSVFEQWIGDGLALVEDLNASLPEGHPYRLAWHALYQKHKRLPARPLNRYYNAGFIGLPLSCADFLTLWEEIVDWAGEETGSLTKLKNASPHALFHSADQDAMNMALELSTHPLHTAGPEAMDFIPGGHLISHAAGGTKPWRGGFLRDALRGTPPGLPQKAFYDFTDGPIVVLPKGLASRRRLELKLAALIGRFYARR